MSAASDGNLSPGTNLLLPWAEPCCGRRPAAGIEAGEAPRAALRRELREEAGLVVGVDPKNVPGCVVLPRRWVVERSHAWIMHARRHARDYERLIQHSESLITWAAITHMPRGSVDAPPNAASVGWQYAGLAGAAVQGELSART